MKTRTDKYEIACRVANADLDGFEGKMTAKQQREVFGGYLFGRKTIRIDARGQGKVTGTFVVCFGTDSVFFEKSFDQIAEAVNDDVPFSF